MCSTPSVDRTSIDPAATKAAMAAMRAMVAIVPNAYAFSSNPRNVSPLKTVLTVAANLVLVGSA